MIEFAADQNFDMRIATALWRLEPAVVVIHLSEENDTRINDDKVLEWSAGLGLILLTQDERTMPTHAFNRIAKSLPMPGVIIVPRWLSVGEAARDLFTFVQCSTDGEYEGRVLHLPL